MYGTRCIKMEKKVTIQGQAYKIVFVHAMKTYGESGERDPRILNFGILDGAVW